MAGAEYLSSQYKLMPLALYKHKVQGTSAVQLNGGFRGLGFRGLGFRGLGLHNGESNGQDYGA